jgi:hypothetical protein
MAKLGSTGHPAHRVNIAMIKFELLRDRSILFITPLGPLEKEDFEQLAKEIDPFIAANGKLVGVMIHAKSFPGWESFGALVSHLKFVADHHRKIERIAAVTDSGFLKIVPRVASHFVQAKIKHFEFEEKDRALAWLEAGG